MSRFESIFERLPSRLAGHAWTVVPTLEPQTHWAPPSTRWERWFDDPDVGRVGIHGRFRGLAESTDLVLLVHGLGGSPDSRYLQRAALRLDDLGVSSLRVGLRGSDGFGRDFYHGGITHDLQEVLADPIVEPFERIWIVGYSLGGHIAMATATEKLDPRVKGIGAICSPVNLESGQKIIDAPRKFIYREYILRELRMLYAEVAREREVVTSHDRVQSVRSLLEWDELTVAPRFGFDSALDYYRSVSMAHRFGDLTVPSLLVYTAHDPMVTADAIEPHLEGSWSNFESVRVESGGHVYFPGAVDLGVDAPRKLMDQVLGRLGYSRS